VPAAAVIPAPIAYIQVVAVKKRVVEFRVLLNGLGASSRLFWQDLFLLGNQGALYCVLCGSRTVTLKKLECLKQA
jgi:hypothetical protein